MLKKTLKPVKAPLSAYQTLKAAENQHVKTHKRKPQPQASQTRRRIDDVLHL